MRAADTNGASGNNRKAFTAIGEIEAGHVATKEIGEGEAIDHETVQLIPERRYGCYVRRINS